MKKKLWCLFLMFMLLIPVSVVFADSSVNNTANKAVYRVMTKTLSGNKIQMDFYVDGFSSVYGTQVYLNFNKSALQAMEIIDGSVISGNNVKPISKTFSNENGSITYCITKVGDLGARVNSGVLFSAIFEKKSNESFNFSLNGTKSLICDYQGNTFSFESNESVYQFMEIKNLSSQSNFTLGSDAKIAVRAKNNGTYSKDVTLIVGLYDGKTNKLLNYVAVTHTVNPQDIVDLNAMMSIPKTGNYRLRCFTWDNLNDMNALSPSLDMEIK